MGKITVQEQTEPASPNSGFIVLYPDSSDDLLKYKRSDGSVIILRDGSGVPIQESPSGAVNGSNTVFVFSQTPISSQAMNLYLDGLWRLQGPSGSGGEYFMSGASATFYTAPESLQVVTGAYFY
jgi:hypothetical protein